MRGRSILNLRPGKPKWKSVAFVFGDMPAQHRVLSGMLADVRRPGVYTVPYGEAGRMRAGVCVDIERAQEFRRAGDYEHARGVLAFCRSARRALQSVNR